MHSDKNAQWQICTVATMHGNKGTVANMHSGKYAQWQKCTVAKMHGGKYAQ